MEQRRNIVLLLLGRTVSTFGAAFYLIALPLFMLKTTENLARTGVFFTLSSLPALLVTPFLGVFVEKVDRKRLIVLCDLLTALVYLVLLLAPEEPRSYLPLLFAGTVLINIIAHAFDIGSKLIFSELLDDAVLERYNGMKSICDNTAAIAAPALGTVVFNLWGFRSVLLVACIAYALSALQECFILYHRAGTGVGREKKSWFRQFWEGLMYVKGDKSLLSMFLLAMALNFFVANAEEIINPGILMQKYRLPDSLYGLTSSAVVAGTLLAGVFIYRNKRLDLRSRMKFFLLLNSGVMILIGVLSLVMTPWPIAYFALFVLGEFLVGGVTALVNVPLISGFQTRVPLELQGRFFALLSVGAGLLIPLGISYAGFLAELVGADVAYIINNVCVIVVVLFCGKALTDRSVNLQEGDKF